MAEPSGTPTLGATLAGQRGVPVIPMGPIEDRSKDVISVTIAMVVPAIVIVAMRLWVRASIVGKLGADDWCIMAAAIFSVAMGSMVIMSAQHGAGKHMKDIEPLDISLALKYNFISQVFAVPCMMMVKVSIGMFLLRLASTKMYRNICLGFIVIMTAYSTASTFSIIFQCLPIEFTWDTTVPGGKCLAPAVRVNLGKSYSIICAASDFFIVILPIAMLWNVQIKRRQRFMICGVLGVGTFAAAASIVKTTFINKYGATGDFLWDSVDVSSWTTIENNVAILSASMPALKPLVTRILQSTIYSKSQGSKDLISGHKLSQLRRDGSAGMSSRSGGITTNIHVGHKIHRSLDNESEERIFGISKSTEMRVDVETISNNSADLGVRQSDVNRVRN
ncbi:hypothetical protein BZA77DRAFT_388716 [Pyronema omphalodes]|nr:hypothetical protein BZA77DRAFT_388716 [Pyronema omphalodes]